MLQRGYKVLDRGCGSVVVLGGFFLLILVKVGVKKYKSRQA